METGEEIDTGERKEERMAEGSQEERKRGERQRKTEAGGRQEEKGTGGRQEYEKRTGGSQAKRVSQTQESSVHSEGEGGGKKGAAVSTNHLLSGGSSHNSQSSSGHNSSGSVASNKVVDLGAMDADIQVNQTFLFLQSFPSDHKPFPSHLLHHFFFSLFLPPPISDLPLLDPLILFHPRPSKCPIFYTTVISGEQILRQ